MLDKQVIHESAGPFAILIVLVRKKDSLCMCVNYRALNEMTEKDAFPIQRVDDYLDTLGGSKLCSSLNLASGYRQVAMKPEDKEETVYTDFN